MRKVSLSFKDQATVHITVKWSIVERAVPRKIQCDWLDTQNQNKRLKHATTFIVLPIGIVAPSIVRNDNSQYLLFSLLF